MICTSSLVRNQVYFANNVYFEFRNEHKIEIIDTNETLCYMEI